MQELVWLFLLGLEVDRFPTVNDGADSLGSSLEVVEAGGYRLGSYEGPAFQPVLAVRRGPFGLALLPALAGRMEALESVDGREGTLFVRQWRLEGRLQFGGRVFGELDVAGSGGAANLSGERVARAAGEFDLGPALGVRTSIGHPDLWLTGRVGYGWRIQDGLQVDGLTGSVAIEWRLGGG